MEKVLKMLLTSQKCKKTYNISLKTVMVSVLKEDAKSRSGIKSQATFYLYLILRVNDIAFEK